MRKIKYKELQDKNWLYQKHVIEKLSCRTIAKLIGAKYYTSVRDALKRLNIPSSSPRNHAPSGKSHIEILNDKDWLLEKYVNCKWGLNKIAKEVNAKSSSTVRDALIRFKIPVRDRSSGYLACRCVNDFMIFSDESISIINGCLLGDGTLRQACINTSFAKTNIGYDHIEYVAKKIFSDNFRDRITGPLFCKNRGIFKDGRKILSSSPFFRLSSIVHTELNDLYTKWYKNGIKVVPEDLILDKVSLLHWFMDDGYSQYKYIRKKDKSVAIRIVLCTDCFLIEDQKKLCDKLRSSLGLVFHIQKRGKYFRLELSKKDTRKFYEIIGPCPVPSMQYKWK